MVYGKNTEGCSDLKMRNNLTKSDRSRRTDVPLLSIFKSMCLQPKDAIFSVYWSVGATIVTSQFNFTNAFIKPLLKLIAFQEVLIAIIKFLLLFIQNTQKDKTYKETKPKKSLHMKTKHTTKLRKV